MIGKSVCDKKLCNLQSARKLAIVVMVSCFFRILSRVNHSCETKRNGTESKYIYFNLFFSTNKKRTFFPDAIKTFIFSHQQKRGSIVLKTEWKTNESNRSRQRAEKKNNCSCFSIESWRQIYFSHWFSHRSLPIFFIFYFISFFVRMIFFFCFEFFSTNKFVLLLFFLNLVEFA